MSTIAITGVGGLLGRLLVAALDTDGTVERVIGIDRHAPRGITSSKLVYRHGDVRDPDLAEVLRGVDVLVHLAFVTDPDHDEAAMRATNVDGTRHVFESALAAGVGHVVYPSSALVHGAHPDNDVPLSEDAPRRGIPGYNAVEHKREIEDWLWPWLERTGLPVAVLRFATLLGPGIDNAMTRSFEAPRFPVVKGHRPPWQFLHPDDAVSAIVHAVHHRLTGAYAAAAEGWISTDELTAIVGRGRIEIPEEVAYSATARLWSLGIGEQPPGLVSLFIHPCVVSPARLIATGWRPRHSNRDAVASMAAEHAPYVAALGVRTRWSTLRRLAGGLAATLTLVLLRRRVGRRRARPDRDAPPTARPEPDGTDGAPPASSPTD